MALTRSVDYPLARSTCSTMRSTSAPARTSKGEGVEGLRVGRARAAQVASENLAGRRGEEVSPSTGHYFELLNRLSQWGILTSVASPTLTLQHRRQALFLAVMSHLLSRGRVSWRQVGSGRWSAGTRVKCHSAH